MKLHYRKTGEGKPLIILHGLFGSADNWQTLAKKFSEDFTVYLVDQRNHGRSPHDNEMSYDAMADDLTELMRDEGIGSAHLLGHSMGGKTVLFFALKHPEMIDKMIIADMGLKRYPPHHDTIFNALLSADLDKLTTRKEVEDHVKEYITDPSVVQFLLKNLYWSDREKLEWRINLQVLYREIDEILGEVPSGNIPVKTLFIRGGKSNYIPDEDIPEIKKQIPDSEFYTIENAGHWVHAEAPQEFYQEVIRYLKN